MNKRFKVRHKDTLKIYKVFDITYDNNGFPHFLIHEDNQWIIKSAKHFEPWDY